MSSEGSGAELCLSDEDFDTSVRRLLTVLNDGRPLNAQPANLLGGLIRKAGHKPIISEDLEPSDQLRANLRLLLQQISEDETVRRLLDTYSVDEVLAWLLHPVVVEREEV